MNQATRRMVLVSGLIAMGASSSLLAQATPIANANAGTSTATPAAKSSGIPQRDTLVRMMRPVSNVEFADQRLEDVMKFIITVTGADIEVMWGGDASGKEGLDKEQQITLKFIRGTALQLLERVLDKTQTESGTNGHAWQMTESGAMQVGPKPRLNAYRRVVVYSITDLIQDIPDYTNAPEFDLQSVLQNSGQGGGGGGQSPFRANQQQRQDRRPFAERANELRKILTGLVEPEQWTDNGGESSTMQYFQGSFIVNAPDYVHRGLDGYPYWPATATKVTTQGGRRYVSLGVDTAISKLRGFENQPITGVASGVPAGGGGGSGRPPTDPPGGGSTVKPKK